MHTIQTRSHIGPDGMLDIRLASGVINADVDVLVVVTPITTNGAHVVASQPSPTLRPKMTREAWEEFIHQTAGSIPDFPDNERPGPDSFEKRDEF